MKGSRRQWWGGLAGIVTVLSLAAASVLVRHSPSTDQPTGDVTGYFTGHRTSALLAAYLLGFGATVLLFFVGALHELLSRDTELHGLADVAFAAGVTLVAVGGRRGRDAGRACLPARRHPGGRPDTV
jgi:hypothetical protein